MNDHACSRAGSRAHRVAAVATLAGAFLTVAPSNAGPATAEIGSATSGRVQKVELVLYWNSATGLPDYANKAAIIEVPFCFPTHEEGLDPNFWYTTDLTMSATGSLSGQCAANPRYPSYDADDTFDSTFNGQVDLGSVHETDGSYAGSITWKIEGQHRTVLDEGTRTEHISVSFSDAEGWFPASETALDVPSGAGGDAQYVYTCEATGRMVCQEGERLEGEVDHLLSFAEPEEGGGTCAPSGYVTDVAGAPVVGVTLRLDAGESQQTVTDVNGYYAFDTVGGAPTEDFNPAVDAITVTLMLIEGAHTPNRFQIFDNDLSTSITPPGWRIDDRPGCVQDFAFAEEPPDTWTSSTFLYHWPGLVQLYQGTWRAWALADLLGEDLTYGLPLAVHGWCSIARDCPGFIKASNDFGFAAVTSSKGALVVDEPYIAFGPGTSELSNREWPANREYHEFGHYFLAATFGGLPESPEGDVNHAGYKNLDSADSWTEGFAEWYSAMVSQYIDRRPDYYVYPFGDSMQASFLDAIPAWAIEEMAVASLLTTVEANPEPTPVPPVPLEVGGFTTTTDARFGPLLIGSVTNLGNRTARAVRIRATPSSGAWSQQGFTMPRDLRPGTAGVFVMLVPEVLDPSDLGVVVEETGYTRPDLPPPLQVSLHDLWRVMKNYVSAKALSNGHLHDVEDLYDAFKAAWGGMNVSPEGLDSVDQMFVRHVFYDNTAHTSPLEFTYEPGETIGATSHREFGLDALGGAPCTGTKLCSPERSPRTDVDPPEYAYATIDTGGVTGAAYVQVDYPGDRSAMGYGTSAPIGGDGRVAVPVPPAGSGATVTVIAVADGRTPVVLDVITADDYWQRVVASGGSPVLSYTATLESGDFTLPDLSPVGPIPKGTDTTTPTSVPGTTGPGTTDAPDTTEGDQSGLDLGGSGSNTGRNLAIVLVVLAATGGGLFWWARRSRRAP